MKRINTLDGIRGIAVLMVVAGHIVTNYQPLDPTHREWLLAFANPGAGVRLFFVLSGYLITHLLAEEKATTGSIALGRFYGRRALRIFPAFYAYLATLVVLSVWMPVGINRSTAAAAGTFTWNYSAFWVVEPAEGIWNLGHLWTLALEQQFYLFWPLLLILFGLRRSITFAFLLAAWCPIARVATYFLFPEQRGQLGMMFHTAIDSLMIGCAVALLVRSTRRAAFLRRHGVVGTTVAALWLFVLSPLASQSIRGFPIVGGFTFDAISAAWIIAWAHHTPSAGALNLLGRGLLPALGTLSYSLYLWQQIFLSPSGPLRDGDVLLPCLAALAAAVVSYYLVERPALRFKTRCQSPMRVSPVSTPG